MPRVVHAGLGDVLEVGLEWVGKTRLERDRLP